MRVWVCICLPGIQSEVNGLPTLVLKLARKIPRLVKMTPRTVIIRTSWMRAIQGFTKILPAHVRPAPTVPTSETNASWPIASGILLPDEV